MTKITNPQFIKDYLDKLKEIKNISKTHLCAYLQALVPENAEYFTITGGTPSFNDGDICTFHIYSDSVRIKFISEEDLIDKYDTEDEKYEEIFDTLIENVEVVPDDMYSTVFDPYGFILTVYKDKIKSDSYDIN